MCGLSDDRCTGFSTVFWLFRSSMFGLLVVLFVPLFFSFMAMPRCCCFLLPPCNTLASPSTQRLQSQQQLSRNEILPSVLHT